MGYKSSAWEYEPMMYNSNKMEGFILFAIQRTEIKQWKLLKKQGFYWERRRRENVTSLMIGANENKTRPDSDVKLEINLHLLAQKIIKQNTNL